MDDSSTMLTSLAARTCILFLALSLCFRAVYAAKPAPSPDHWVGTWATASVERPNANAALGESDTTLRQIVHVSLGGPLVRIELSNEFGTEPLAIGAAHIALSAGKGAISLSSANAMSFSGKSSVTIPAGAVVVSDPVVLALPRLSDLVISIFLPAQKISHLTVHNSAYQTNYLVPGNQVGAKSMPTDGVKTNTSWFFLKAVDVRTAALTGAVVAFGDSITDGTASTPDANARWPDVLARRLQGNRQTAGLGVLNVGIGGNRVLLDGTGPSALARFDQDVLAQSGVRYMIVLESINDIGHAEDPKNPYDPVSADDLTAGLTQLVERAHMHGIKVFGATLTPYLGAGYSSPAGEEIRKAVNQWIRGSKVFDGVIDFEAATMDKTTGAFLPADDHGDHLHPNDAGLKAMGNAIDLRLFEPSKAEKYDITHQP